MKLFIALMALVMAGTAYAQTAKVEALTPEETRKARGLTDEIAMLQQELDALRKEIRVKHLAGPGGNCFNIQIAASLQTVKPGWGCGDFEFSDDYRYIVPFGLCNTTCQSLWGTVPGFAPVPATNTAKGDQK